MPPLSNMSTMEGKFPAISVPLGAWKLFPLAWINFILPFFCSHRSDNAVDVILKVSRCLFLICCQFWVLGELSFGREISWSEGRQFSHAINFMLPHAQLLVTDHNQAVMLAPFARNSGRPRPVLTLSVEWDGKAWRVVWIKLFRGRISHAYLWVPLPFFSESSKTGSGAELPRMRKRPCEASSFHGSFHLKIFTPEKKRIKSASL